MVIFPKIKELDTSIILVGKKLEVKKEGERESNGNVKDRDRVLGIYGI